jgi:hypothetical protein
VAVTPPPYPTSLFTLESLIKLSFLGGEIIVSDKLENFSIVYKDIVLPVGSVPVDLSMKDFMTWIINKMELPKRDGKGNYFKYSLRLQETGDLLDINGTIAESKIDENDVIEVVRTVQEVDMSANAKPVIEIVPASEVVPESSIEKETLRAIENLGNKVVDNLSDASERRHKLRDAEIGVTRYLLIIFAIALLASLFFAFYLIVIDKLNPVGNFLYPIISLILGFFSGYFAGGSGRDLRKK